MRSFDLRIHPVSESIAYHQQLFPRGRYGDGLYGQHKPRLSVCVPVVLPLLTVVINVFVSLNDLSREDGLVVKQFGDLPRSFLCRGRPRIEAG